MNSWRKIKGFDGRYQIDREGHIRSIPFTDARGVLHGRRRLTPFVMNNGYLAVMLGGGAKKKCVYIHRLLAEAFIPNPERKPEINHKDCDKQNNDLGNLEWCSHKENMRHAYSNWLLPRLVSGPGEKSPAAKLSYEAVASIKRSLADGITQREIAKRFGVAQSTISWIARGVTWKEAA